jgi:energy-converting hydrogenase Eha subunit A
LFRHSHCLVLGQQTIEAIRRGTLMRHSIFARPVAACSRRMIDAAVTARLVTATGFALRASTRFPGAAFGAINMAAVAMAADQYLDPAALTQEQPRRHSIGMVVAIPIRIRGLRLMPWTRSLPGAMMPLHSCSGTVCGARRRCELPRWDRCRACLPISARCYRDSRSPVRREASEDRPKRQPNSGNWTTAASFAAPAIRMAAVSIKMSVGGFDDARKPGLHLASWRSAGGAAPASRALSDRRFDLLLPTTGL